MQIILNSGLVLLIVYGTSKNKSESFTVFCLLYPLGWRFVAAGGSNHDIHWGEYRLPHIFIGAIRPSGPAQYVDILRWTGCPGGDNSLSWPLVHLLPGAYGLLFKCWNYLLWEINFFLLIWLGVEWLLFKYDISFDALHEWDANQLHYHHLHRLHYCYLTVIVLILDWNIFQ